MTATRTEHRELVSYLTLRRVVGLLGVGLPPILATWGFFLLGSFTLEPSISDYYALRTRDALTGILFTIAWFLFTYRGYDRNDDIAGNLGCVFALGVALFPVTGPAWEDHVHLVAAAGLFLVLAYFSLFLFTKSQGAPTAAKCTRNIVYRICGCVMLVCIALIAVYRHFLATTTLSVFAPEFWLETIALWAFGFSWFVKGETLWKDA